MSEKMEIIQGISISRSYGMLGADLPDEQQMIPRNLILLKINLSRLSSAQNSEMNSSESWNPAKFSADITMWAPVCREAVLWFYTLHNVTYLNCRNCWVSTEILLSLRFTPTTSVMQTCFPLLWLLRTRGNMRDVYLTLATPKCTCWVWKGSRWFTIGWYGTCWAPRRKDTYYLGRSLKKSFKWTGSFGIRQYTSDSFTLFLWLNNVGNTLETPYYYYLKTMFAIPLLEPQGDHPEQERQPLVKRL